MEPAIWAAEDWPVQHTRGNYHAWNSVAFDASHGGVRCFASKQSVVRAVRRGDPSDSIRSSRCKTSKRRDGCWSDRAGRAARCGIRPFGEGRCAAAGRRHSFRDRFGNEGVHVVAAGRHVAAGRSFVGRSGLKVPVSVKRPGRNGRVITPVDPATHTSGLPRLPLNLSPKDPATAGATN